MLGVSTKTRLEAHGVKLHLIFDFREARAVGKEAQAVIHVGEVTVDGTNSLQDSPHDPIGAMATAKLAEAGAGNAIAVYVPLSYRAPWLPCPLVIMLETPSPRTIKLKL